MIESSRIKVTVKNEVEIVKISTLAKETKKIDPNTIDVSIGALYDDNGNFFESSAMSKAIAELSPEEKYTYSPLIGPKSFAPVLEKWLFGKYHEELEREMHSYTTVTLGGSAALSNALYTYLAPKECLLLPDTYWNVYQKMVEAIDCNYIEYRMFEKNIFSLKDFKKQANKIIKKQHKLVTLINTPNHNPTGYSLSNKEISELIDYCNSLSPIPIIIILDTAYIDFSDYMETREVFKHLTNLKENTLVIVSYSGSKTFASYGLRFGANTFLSKDIDTIENAKITQPFLIRSRVGSPNHMVISAFEHLMNKKELFNEFLIQLDEMKNLLQYRFNLLSKYLNDNNINYLPYKGGFFILIPTTKSNEIYELLKEKHIFVIPFEKGIRIAICSLQSKDIERFVDELKRVI